MKYNKLSFFQKLQYFVFLALFCACPWLMSQEVASNEKMNAIYVCDEKDIDLLAQIIQNCNTEVRAVLGESPKPKDNLPTLYFVYNQKIPKNIDNAIILSSTMSKQEILYRIAQAIIIRDYCHEDVYYKSLAQLKEIDWVIAAIIAMQTHGIVENRFIKLPHFTNLFNYYSYDNPFNIEKWIKTPVSPSDEFAYSFYSLNSLFLTYFLDQKKKGAICEWLVKWSMNLKIEDINDQTFYYSISNVERKNIAKYLTVEMRLNLLQTSIITISDLRNIVKYIEKVIPLIHEQEKVDPLLRAEALGTIGNIGLPGKVVLAKDNEVNILNDYRIATYNYISNKTTGNAHQYLHAKNRLENLLHQYAIIENMFDNAEKKYFLSSQIYSKEIAIFNSLNNDCNEIKVITGKYLDKYLEKKQNNHN